MILGICYFNNWDISMNRSSFKDKMNAKKLKYVRNKFDCKYLMDSEELS